MDGSQELQFGTLQTVKEGEEETKEQRELRLGRRFSRVKSKYKGLYLKEIENKQKKEIVRKIREIDKKYPSKLEYDQNLRLKKEKKKINLVQKIGNEKMSKLIINLIKTKNATPTQLQKIADFYGVELEKIKNEKEER